MSKVKDFKNLDEAIKEEEFKELSENASLDNEENKPKNPKKPLLTEVEIKKRKARRTRVAAAAFVLLLGAGIMGNWYYENSDFSATVKPVVSSQSKTLGEAEFVDGTANVSVKPESEYFSSARVERQTSRDEAIEKLQSIIDNESSTNEAKTAASEGITRISNIISIENKIETLVCAKGAENCLAVVSDDGTRVDVIVDIPELTDEAALQIKEIAMQQLGCTFDKVSIIQSNS